jgi:hypothetical protein
LSDWLVVDVVSQHRLDFVPPGDLAFFVRYGHEARIGFWAELRSRDHSRAIAVYSALDAEYRHDRPLLGVLEWLAQVGAFPASALEEALAAWGSTERVRLSRGAKRALQVIRVLTKEADE